MIFLHPGPPGIFSSFIFILMSCKSDVNCAWHGLSLPAPAAVALVPLSSTFGGEGGGEGRGGRPRRAGGGGRGNMAP